MHQPGEAALEIEDELRANERGNRSKVNMPKVRAQREAFEPFRSVNRSVGPFVSNLRFEERISNHDDRNTRAIRSQSLRIVKIVGERSEAFRPCWRKVGEC